MGERIRGADSPKIAQMNSDLKVFSSARSKKCSAENSVVMLFRHGPLREMQHSLSPLPALVYVCTGVIDAVNKVQI